MIRVLFVSGEWVNEWNVTSGSQSEYQDFGRAQLEVYNAASFGWAYWTLKNDRKHWDFEWNIRNNYLRLSNILNPSPFCFQTWILNPLVLSHFTLTYIHAGSSEKKVFNSLRWLLLASICFYQCQILELVENWIWTCWRWKIKCGFLFSVFLFQKPYLKLFATPLQSCHFIHFGKCASPIIFLE